jgi:hypothetical protein
MMVNSVVKTTDVIYATVRNSRGGRECSASSVIIAEYEAGG